MPAFHALYIVVSHLGCPGAVDPVCSSGVTEPVWTSEDQLELKKRHIASLFNLRGRVLSDHTALPHPTPVVSHQDLKPHLLHEVLIYKLHFKFTFKMCKAFSPSCFMFCGQELIM